MLHLDAAAALAGLQRAITGIEQGLQGVASSSLPGGGGFSSLFQQVSQEVSEFIQNGSAGSTDVPTFHAEGWFHHSRNQVQGTQSTQGTNDVIAAIAPAASGEQRQHFVQTMAPLAEQAAAQLGVAPELLVAHAALESGWGQRPLRQANGQDSHNLFGIKAGTRWQGESTQVWTTEYEQGQSLMRNERFRSYPDHASAFADYAQLLSSARYQGAVGTGSDARAFAQGLVRGGYASDPAYADKLVRVAASVKASAYNALQSRSGRE